MNLFVRIGTATVGLVAGGATALALAAPAAAGDHDGQTAGNPHSSQSDKTRTKPDHTGDDHKNGSKQEDRQHDGKSDGDHHGSEGKDSHDKDGKKNDKGSNDKGSKGRHGKAGGHDYDGDDIKHRLGLDERHGRHLHVFEWSTEPGDIVLDVDTNHDGRGDRRITLHRDRLGGKHFAKGWHGGMIDIEGRRRLWVTGDDSDGEVRHVFHKRHDGKQDELNLCKDRHKPHHHKPHETEPATPPATQPEQEPVSNNSTLPVTGTAMGGVVGAGVLLASGGGLALILGRRRRAAASRTR